MGSDWGSRGTGPCLGEGGSRGGGFGRWRPLVLVGLLLLVVTLVFLDWLVTRKAWAGGEGEVSDQRGEGRSGPEVPRFSAWMP